MQHSSSSLAANLAGRASKSIYKKRELKRKEKAQLPKLLADAWAIAKLEAEKRADAGETNFTFGFDEWYTEFRHFSPTVNDIRDALPDEIKELHDEAYQNASVDVAFDQPITFNIYMEFSGHAHRMVKDLQTAADAEANEAATVAAAVSQFGEGPC
tara:strand:- start:587 stop:1054 length:468 start_codon:yes stop_codon:yes gene_type:complete